MSVAGTGRGFGHAKVILVGEHAVVHGHAAVAAGISTGIAVEARPGHRAAAHPGLGAGGRRRRRHVHRPRAGGDRPPHRGAPAGFRGRRADPVAGGAGQLGGDGRRRRARGRRGHGSGGLARDDGRRGAGRRRGFSRHTVGDRRGRRQERSDGPLHPGPRLGADRRCCSRSRSASGCPASHATRPRRWRPSRRLRARLPVAGDVLALLGRLADDAVVALGKGDVDGLGRIFDAAHGLLAALRLSSPELDALVHAARGAGAVGAKLTGAGGGGAVIALAPGHERDVLARWKAAGFDGFLAEISAAPGTLRRSARRERRQHRRDRRVRHQHRAGQVLGQARRGPEPARDRQPVADAGSPGHADAGGVRRRVGRRRSRDAGRRAGRREVRGPRDGVPRSRPRAGAGSRRAPRSIRRTPSRRLPGWRRRRPVSPRWPSPRRAPPGCRCRPPSCPSWRGWDRAPRRARSSAASSRWRAGSGRTVATRWPARSRSVTAARAGTCGWWWRSPPPAKRQSARRRRWPARPRRRRTTMRGCGAWRAIWPMRAPRSPSRDLNALGAVAERSAMRMHASAMAADPPILYWNAATVSAIDDRAGAARARRRRVLHDRRRAAREGAVRGSRRGPVAAALGDTPGVLRTLIAAPGPGARVVEARMSTFSAPGKLFLIGEYGVLHGGTAVVAAVDRRARGQVRAGRPARRRR